MAVYYMHLGGTVGAAFLKTHGLATLSHVFFNTDYDELVKIYVF